MTSRIMFVWADDKEQKVDVPELSEAILTMKQSLVSDLDVINRIAGGYNFTSTSRDWWRKWYNSFDERDPKRLCKDPAFRGWYSRKPMFVLKLGMVLSASRRNTLTVTEEEFQEAIIHIEEVEKEMANAFVAVGKSEVAAEVAIVARIIEQEKVIEEKYLLQRVWRDIDANKFDNVIQTLLKSGVVNRLFTKKVKQDGKEKVVKGVWYKWIGK